MRARLSTDFERFGRDLPRDAAGHVREAYGIDLSARYLGFSLPHPIGKGSGQLSLNPDQLRRFTGQLEGILEYIAKIKQLDTKNVVPMAHALPLHNVLREDVAEAGLPLDKVLQNAPDTDGPFFKVPKVIGGDEDSAG